MKKNPTTLKRFSKFEDEEDIYSSTEDIKEEIMKSKEENMQRQ